MILPSMIKSAAVLLILLYAVQAVWMNKMSGAYSAFIAVDNQGSLFVTARCITACSFYDIGSNQASSALNVQGGAGGIIIAKYFNNGSMEWKLRVDGSQSDWVLSIATNSVGDVVVVMQTQSNPVTVHDIRNNPVTTFGIVSASSGLLLSFASNDTYNWGARLTGSFHYANALETFNSVAFGPQDEIIATARFTATFLAVYDSSRQVVANISTAGQNGVFAAKFTRNGVLVWLTQFGGTDNCIYSTAWVDLFGDVLFMSEAAAAIQVRDQAGNVTTVSGIGSYAYMVKLAGGNGSFIWSNKMLSGSGQERISALRTDSAGNVYTCGYFTAPAVSVEDVLASNIKILGYGGRLLD